MRTALVATALAGGLLLAGVVGAATAADDTGPRPAPRTSDVGEGGAVPEPVREDEGPGTETVPVREDEGPGTETVPVREDEGPGTETVPVREDEGPGTG